jgi:hypothetical protein
MGTRTPRKVRAKTEHRTRHSVGAQVTAEEYDRVLAECRLRGCTPSELVRAGLKLDEAPPLRPLLVAAGQLIRAGNAHAAAARRGEWKAAAAGVDQLNAHAAELIRIVVEDRGRR